MARSDDSTPATIHEYNAFVLRHWKRNFWLNAVDAAVYGMGIALAQPDTVLPGFMQDTIARVPELASYENRLVGVLMLVWGVCLMLPQQLLTAKLCEGRGRVKGPLIAFAILERVPWLLLGLATAYVAPANPRLAMYLFFGFVFMYQFNIGLIYPVWQEMVAKTTPVRRRGLLFGVREAMGGVLGFGALMFFGRRFSGLEYPRNYAALFFGMFVCITVTLVPLAFLKEAEYPIERPKRTLGEYFSGLWAVVGSDGRFLRYFLCRSVFGLSLVAAPSFFALKAVRVMGGQAAEQAVALAMVTMLARAPAAMLVGWLGDRFGYRVVMATAGVVGGAGIGCALWAQGIWGFYAAYALSTFSAMAFWVGRSNYVLELAPLEKRPSYIGIDNMSGLVFVAAPFLGGWLADRQGSSDMQFAIGGVLALLAGVLFIAVAVEPRKGLRSDLVA